MDDPLFADPPPPDASRLKKLILDIGDGVRERWSRQSPNLALEPIERRAVVERFLATILAQRHSPDTRITPEMAAFHHVMADLRERLTIDQFFSTFSLLYWSVREELKSHVMASHELLWLFQAISQAIDSVLWESAKEWSLERELTNQLKDELTGLYRIASAIITDPELDEVLATVVEEISTLLGADFCALLQPVEENEAFLEIKSLKNQGGEIEKSLLFSLEAGGIVAQAYKSGETQRAIVSAVSENEPTLEGLGFKHLIAAPLKVQNRILGVACAANRDEKRRFGESHAYLLSTICSQAAASIWNAQLFESNARISLDLVLTLAQALDARDSYTHNHSTNVAGIAKKLATEMKLPQEDIDEIFVSGLLHDIGKIGIADAVLHKPGALNRAERQLMMQHPAKGAQIIQPVRGLRAVIPGIRHHHERWDGSGYPDRLAGEDIPLPARILGLADAFDVMCHHRVYRRARTKEEIAEDLHQSSGKQFDPTVVDALVRLLERKGTGDLLKTPVTSPQAFEPEPEKASDRLGALLDFGKQLSACLTPGGVMQKAVESAKKMMGADVTSIWLAQNGQNMVFSASAGRSRPPASEIIPIGGEGLVGYVSYRRIATAVSDYDSENRFSIPHWIRDAGFCSALAVPIEQGDRLLGVLINHSHRAQHFNNEHVQALETIASYVALALECTQLKTQYQEHSTIDSLTGLPNLRHFQEKLSIDLEQSSRSNCPLGLLMLDMDHFCLYNEQYGHSLGDEAIQKIGQILRRFTGPQDIAGRLGGEEFGLILPGKTQEQSTVIAEKIRETVAQTDFPAKVGESCHLTLSIGITAFPEPTRDSSTVLQDANAALGRAKRAGRNRVWVR